MRPRFAAPRRVPPQAMEAKSCPPFALAASLQSRPKVDPKVVVARVAEAVVDPQVGVVDEVVAAASLAVVRNVVARVAEAVVAAVVDVAA